MLQSLTVRDFALFSSASITLSEGFLALTGQTGAGKSLVVDALAFIAGYRTGREVIRAGKQSCEVYALFSPVDESRIEALKELGIETECDGIEFYRSLSHDARGVCRINGRTTTLTVLKSAVHLFLDIHEQEGAHALLDSSRHVFYLDAYAKELAPTASEYKRKYAEYNELKRRFNALYSVDRAEEKARREFLEYQIRELESAKITEGEEAALLEKKARLAANKKLSDAQSFIRHAVTGEGGAYDSVLKAAELLSGLQDVIPEWGKVAERLEELGTELSELCQRVTADDEGEDPSCALDMIEERLSLLRRLYHLYAPDEKGLLQALSEKRAELSAIDSAKEEAKRLHAEALEARKCAAEVAQRLHEIRLSAAKRLEEEILQALSGLDMPGVRFEVRLVPLDKLGEDGMDAVEFYIGTNVGQPMMPLSKIASGGELSRILLALRCVLSRIDGIDTLVFDEIDTGVSGKSAVKIGSAMRTLATERQVLAVTHSAQVASAAHRQMKVEKAVEQGRTVARIFPVEGDVRTEEIARILSGEQVSQTSLAAARELLDSYKN